MTRRYYFVGEKPSPTAIQRGWKWQHGRLAAKQLFDALETCGIDPESDQCLFDNAFAPGAINRITVALGCNYVVVAMGLKCQQRLAEHSIPFLPLVHPAARGAIRRKDRYARHVQEVLGKVGAP